MDGYLFPGVQLEGGDADLPDLLLTGSKQKVPMRPGRQRHLGDKHSFVTFAEWAAARFKYQQGEQWTLKTEDSTATDLQSSGSQIYAGTGDGLGLKAHKHIGPQAVVHVVPVEAEAHTKNT